MADADRLFREAQHALQNVSPGSTDEHRNIARAKSYALQVVQKFPHSIEAAQAREILARLDIKVPAPSRPVLAKRAPAASFEKRIPQLAMKDKTSNAMNRFAQITSIDDQWRNIARRFFALPSGKKKLLAIGLLFVVALTPFFLFVVFGLSVVYALNLPMLKRHLNRLLNSLESNR